MDVLEARAEFSLAGSREPRSVAELQKAVDYLLISYIYS